MKDYKSNKSVSGLYESPKALILAISDQDIMAVSGAPGEDIGPWSPISMDAVEEIQQVEPVDFSH